MNEDINSHSEARHIEELSAGIKNIKEIADANRIGIEINAANITVNDATIDKLLRKLQGMMKNQKQILQPY